MRVQRLRSEASIATKARRELVRGKLPDVRADAAEQSGDDVVRQIHHQTTPAPRSSSSRSDKPSSFRTAVVCSPIFGGGSLISALDAEPSFRGLPMCFQAPEPGTSASKTMSRAANCSSAKVSENELTGPTQTSRPSNSAIHSARVFFWKSA